MHPPPSITTFRNHGGYWQPQRIQQDDQTIEITQPYTAISFVRSFLSLHSSFLLALITDLVSSVYTVLQYSIGFLSLIPSEMLACLSPPQEFSFVFSPENQARDAFLSSEITRQSSSCYSFAFLSQCRVFKTFLCLRPIFTISRLVFISAQNILRSHQVSGRILEPLFHWNLFSSAQLDLVSVVFHYNCV